jgi:hypothetical protein
METWGNNILYKYMQGIGCQLELEKIFIKYNAHARMTPLGGNKIKTRIWKTFKNRDENLL